MWNVPFPYALCVSGCLQQWETLQRQSVFDIHSRGNNNLHLTAHAWCHTRRSLCFSACPLRTRGTSLASFFLKGLFCPLCSSSSRALLRRWCRVKTTSHNHTLSVLLTPGLTPSLTQKKYKAGGFLPPHYISWCFLPSSHPLSHSVHHNLLLPADIPSFPAINST